MNDQTLTPRQQEVLSELLKGSTNKQIARSLSMAEATVKIHLTNIFRILGVANRYQALLKAQLTAPDIEPTQDLTDLEILEEFADLAFIAGNVRGSERVIMFGRALEKRKRE